MNEEEFELRFGIKPKLDDLDRVNCVEVGEAGHWQCGVCEEHNKPRFMCDCALISSKGNAL
jgi:hypothetical protein